MEIIRESNYYINLIIPGNYSGYTYDTSRNITNLSSIEG